MNRNEKRRKRQWLTSDDDKQRQILWKRWRKKRKKRKKKKDGSEGKLSRTK